MLSLLVKRKRRKLQLDGTKLLAEQQFSHGVVMSAVAATAAVALWVYASLLFDRYFPWVSMVQGVVIGLAMRRFGQGLDWRFAAVAAGLTALAAVVGSFLVALFLTGREFGTGALTLVDEISLYTIRVFLERDFGLLGLIYMTFAAALAAFYANRRLAPAETVALRRARHDDSAVSTDHDQDGNGEQK